VHFGVRSSGVSQWHRPGDPAPQEMDLDDFDFSAVESATPAADLVFSAPSFDFESTPVVAPPVAMVTPEPVAVSKRVQALEAVEALSAGKKRPGAEKRVTMKPTPFLATLADAPLATAASPAEVMDKKRSSLKEVSLSSHSSLTKTRVSMKPTPFTAALALADSAPVFKASRIGGHVVAPKPAATKGAGTADPVSTTKQALSLFTAPVATGDATAASAITNVNVANVIDSMDIESGAVRVVTSDEDVKQFGESTCWSRWRRCLCSVVLTLVLLAVVLTVMWYLNMLPLENPIAVIPSPSQSVLASIDAATYDQTQKTVTWSMSPLAPLASQASVIMAAAGVSQLVFASVVPVQFDAVVRPFPTLFGLHWPRHLSTVSEHCFCMSL
jgi:hypothetical protein